MAKPVPSRGSDQFVVRFPDGLRDRIREEAEKSGRSMNAEIVATLEEKYPVPVSFGAYVSDWMERFYKDGWDKTNRNKLIDELRNYVTNSAPDIKTITTNYDANSRKYTVLLLRYDDRKLSFSLEDIDE